MVEKLKFRSPNEGVTVTTYGEGMRKYYESRGYTEVKDEPVKSSRKKQDKDEKSSASD